MKLMVWSCLFVLSLSEIVFAQRAGITLGLSQVSLEGSTGVEITDTQSRQFGALFYQPITDAVEVRMGALVAQQVLELEQTGQKSTLKLSYINVPLTAGYRIGERFLLFAGPVISVNGSKSCDYSSGAACSVSQFKVKGTDIQLSLGANFQLTSEFGLELSMDRLGGKPFEGATGGQIVNVNFQYVIE